MARIIIIINNSSSNSIMIAQLVPTTCHIGGRRHGSPSKKYKLTHSTSDDDDDGLTRSSVASLCNKWTKKNGIDDFPHPSHTHTHTNTKIDFIFQSASFLTKFQRDTHTRAQGIMGREWVEEKRTEETNCCCCCCVSRSVHGATSRFFYHSLDAAVDAPNKK